MNLRHLYLARVTVQDAAASSARPVYARRERPIVKSSDYSASYP